jgi:Leucine-rich repeat (LRR) protein
VSDDNLDAAIAARSEPHRLWLTGNRKPLRFNERTLARVPLAVPDLQFWGLDQQPLRRLPAGVGKLTQLSQLSLRDCKKLESLAGIEELAALESVELWGLPALDLRDAFARMAALPKLTQLSLAGKWVRDLPNLELLAHVTRIHIDYAPELAVESVFAALAKLPSLRVLEIRFSETKAPVPDSLGALNLDVLDLGNSKFTALPRSIGKLARLRRLAVQHNQLRALPVEICELGNLEELALSYNGGLRKLPAAIGELGRLTILDVEGTNIKELPESATRWRNMRVLVAPEVVTVPPGFFEAMRFEKVKLPREIAAKAQFCPLDTTGDELEIARVERLQPDLGDPRILTAKLRQLEVPIVGLSTMKRLERATLDIPSTLWPDTIERLAGAPQLHRLQLVGRFEHEWTNELPASIGSLTSLEELFLDHLGLPSLPSTLGKLERLRELGVAGNKLTTLPEELGDLARLEVLNLNENPFAEFPTWIGRLTALHTLRQYSGANVRRLPNEMTSLVNLRELDLKWGHPEAPAVLGELRALRKLSFVKQGPFDWAELFRILAACPLESLAVWTGQMETLPSEISKLTGLKQLWLGQARTRHIPDLSALEKLEFLVVNHDFLASGERVIECLPKGFKRTDRGPTQSVYSRVD